MTVPAGRAEILRYEKWDPNSIEVHIADFLGWAEPGWVVMWGTVIVVIAFPLLYTWFIMALIDCASECRERSEDSNGLVAVWYWLLMFVCATIVFVCQFVMTLLLFWVAYQGLKDFRDWWHAGKK